MNELKVFSNTEFGELGVMLIDGKEYFPATQCARILGYSNPHDAILKHCKADGVVKREGVSYTTNQHGVTSQQITEIKYINEGNLYRLIVSSKLPQAGKFERWVFDEVLPSIRHNGGYVGNIEEIIAKTATAVVSEVMKQIMPLVCSYGRQPTDPFEAATDEKYKIKKQSPTIDTLDDSLKSQVVEMIKCGEYSYQGIADFLADNGVKLSGASVCGYARRHCGIFKKGREKRSLQIVMTEVKEEL